MSTERTKRPDGRKAKEKKTRGLYYKVLFILIAVIIIVLDVIFFLLPDKELSETENRTLQQFPKLNMTTLTNGKFETGFDSYVADQFPARDSWVHMKSTVDILSGKTENNGIFLCRDGYLIQNLTEPTEEKYQENLLKIRDLKVAHQDLWFTALIAPTALTVLKDHLPANAVTGDENAFMDRVKEDLNTIGIRFVDVREALANAAAENQVYYRTDHHWTTAGAYAAYKALAEELDLPGKNTVYTPSLVSDTFRGTLSASSGFRTSETDPIEVYFPQNPQEYSVQYVGEGKISASFYYTENLEARDQYTLFFNGNHPLVKIETDSSSNKVLLVVKDSYANCFVPFLAGDFKKILMVDPRYYIDDIDSLISTEGVTDVLFLYHIGTLAE